MKNKILWHKNENNNKSQKLFLFSNQKVKIEIRLEGLNKSKMSSAEARRMARQKKILANQEGRMKR